MNSFRTEKYPMGARGIKQVEAKKKKKKNRGKNYQQNNVIVDACKSHTIT